MPKRNRLQLQGSLRQAQGVDCLTVNTTIAPTPTPGPRSSSCSKKPACPTRASPTRMAAESGKSATSQESKKNYPRKSAKKIQCIFSDMVRPRFGSICSPNEHHRTTSLVRPSRKLPSPPMTTTLTSSYVFLFHASCQGKCPRPCAAN